MMITTNGRPTLAVPFSGWLSCDDERYICDLLILTVYFQGSFHATMITTHMGRPTLAEPFSGWLSCNDECCLCSLPALTAHFHGGFHAMAITGSDVWHTHMDRADGMAASRLANRRFRVFSEASDIYKVMPQLRKRTLRSWVFFCEHYSTEVQCKRG